MHERSSLDGTLRFDSKAFQQKIVPNIANVQNLLVGSGEGPPIPQVVPDQLESKWNLVMPLMMMC